MAEKVTGKLGTQDEERNALAWFGIEVRGLAEDHGISEDEAAKRFYPDRYQTWLEKVKGRDLAVEW